MNGADLCQWNNLSNIGDGWKRAWVYDLGNDTQHAFTVSAGTNTLNLYPRENGAFINWLTVTTNEFLDIDDYGPDTPVVPCEEIVTTPNDYLHFVADENYSQTITVNPEDGVSSISWTAAEWPQDYSWMNLSNTSGSNGEQVIVSVDISNLEYGSYHYGMVKISNDCLEIDYVFLPVHLNVVGDRPFLSVSPTTLNFGETGISRDITITNSGTLTLDWNVVTPTESWLSLAGTVSGSLNPDQSATVTVVVDRSGLSEDRYSGDIQISSNAGDKFVKVYLRTSLGQYFYSINDHLGNARVVLDEQGDVKEIYDYYPFGKIQRSSITDEPVARFKFTGKELDDEGGLNWFDFGARPYNGEIGRFLCPDPAGQYHSSYVYCGNSPIIMSDPTGLWANDDRLGFYTRYYDEDGELVYDDGVDNGVNVYTTNEIIKRNTNNNGTVNWDKVRNDNGSRIELEDDRLRSLYYGNLNHAWGMNGNLYQFVNGQWIEQEEIVLGIMLLSPGAWINMKGMTNPVAYFQVLKWSRKVPLNMTYKQWVNSGGLVKWRKLSRAWRMTAPVIDVWEAGKMGYSGEALPKGSLKGWKGALKSFSWGIGFYFGQTP